MALGSFMPLTPPLLNSGYSGIVTVGNYAGYFYGFIRPGYDPDLPPIGSLAFPANAPFTIGLFAWVPSTDEFRVDLINGYSGLELSVFGVTLQSVLLDGVWSFGAPISAMPVTPPTSGTISFEIKDTN